MEGFFQFSQILWQLVSNPTNLLVVFVASLLGIGFGALPGLTATLGVALLTTLTYGFDVSTALLALLGLYVGAIYGGSYPSILINIPGTAAAAASALDGYPMSQRGEGAKALGLITSASAIGTFIGLLMLVFIAPFIASVALQFTSFEFFLLALFGILISGTLTGEGGAVKGWIMGMLGLFLATIGRDSLQFFPRFTFDQPALDSGLDIVAVLIGAYGIPQVIKVLSDTSEVKSKASASFDSMKQGFASVYVGVLEAFKYIKHVVRSALIGVGIGAVPGVGEDIAGWVSYSAAKKGSKNPETFGKGNAEGLVSAETANNACVGGAMIPLLTLGIPGSAPAAMLLGALILHGVNPGPTLTTERPDFLLEITAIMMLATFAMFINGTILAQRVAKLLTVPATLFMPLVAVLCVLGSYALGLNVFNIYVMLPFGILAYCLIEMKFPISPLVIGFILGPMADESLRRALLVTEGSLFPLLQRPLAIVLLLIIVVMVLSQVPLINRMFKKKKVVF
ncbi:tripartite tricarboxylate transporter permease [Agaribacter marinus]|uniref:Transporter n=1 Tax=Agaribacter marinus TaxID=1431249 RepID=A0AA37T0V2_9ALTE|nr:tripartite tricarboxylate transporter permease [Agaribacter marinus]GLR69520.1 transporter [Agaribacter marinus]